MTPTLAAAIIAFLTALTALVKVVTDNIKIKNERAETKQERDRDSLELHDQCRENAWEIKRLKEDTAVLKTHLDDHQLQLSIFNTEMAKLSTKMDSVLDAIRELKESSQEKI